MPTLSYKMIDEEERVENDTQKEVIKVLANSWKFYFKRGIHWQHFFITKSRESNGFMRSILYVIAINCVVGWLLGVFVWNATGLIHLLIILAVISLLFGIIRSA